MSSTSKIIRRSLPPLPAAPRQISLAFDSAQLCGMSPSQRARALTHLANLLMLAAGYAVKEASDD
ncbi:hypothetical protein RA280_43115 [Cupriavidus sp. CV2]|uniref:hypothetical protein n=1 Tax=Cupriavidus ulmosensis TaxID=3065913 RepID=UPI00296AE19F|nr:hypothetical protein [Cupriavidus sp. CV2]MDW3688407.1 hypothetical protein [Cupriavidus sp. CV2]